MTVVCAFNCTFLHHTFVIYFCNVLTIVEQVSTVVKWLVMEHIVHFWSTATGVLQQLQFLSMIQHIHCAEINWTGL